MAESDLDNTIKQAAAAPASVNIDGNGATAVDLSKVIEAERHIAANQGVSKSHRGLRFTKLAAPGSM